MNLKFRFAIVSDLHITLPQTIWDHPTRFHLVEVSIPALETVLEHLTQIDLDFLLIPGDLTQHGEPENHTWLQQRLSKLPFPTYVIPGNHDIPVLKANERSIGFTDFPGYYTKFGYQDPTQLYYHCQLLPGVRLIGLNSNSFDDRGNQTGRLDCQQLKWLKEELSAIRGNSGELVLVMIHHNIVEHLPNQSTHPLANRYMLENAGEILDILQQYGVKLVFTGHLHVQDIACANGIYDITTGSLISYPHPYRILEFERDSNGRESLNIVSHRVESVPDFPNLQEFSRQWMGDHSFPFVIKLLTLPPLSLPLGEAELLAPNLRDFWATIADGDGVLDYPCFPNSVRHYIQEYGAVSNGSDIQLMDNNCLLTWL